MFEPEKGAVTRLEVPEVQKGPAPERRIKDAYAARGIYESCSYADEDSSYDRMLIQENKDCAPPLDQRELDNNGQGGRFNFSTGEHAAIVSEATSGLVDIYTNPKSLVTIPLVGAAPGNSITLWGTIMAEEFTVMDRADDESFPTFLNLCDVFANHGIVFGFFPDKNTMSYQSAGLDYFKLPKNASIIASKNEVYTAYGEINPTELWRHMKEDGTAEKGWDADEIRKAVHYSAYSSNRGNTNWEDWERVQRDLKANQCYLDNVADKVKVIYVWNIEFTGKVSFYILTEKALATGDKGPESFENGSKEAERGTFLFTGHDYYDSIEQALQIFPFSVGSGMQLYTVRGLGFLVYQLTMATNVLVCKGLDSASLESSLHIQSDSDENLDDLQMIDFGGGVAFPSSVKFPQRQPMQGLTNSLIPAINLTKSYVDRSTGGISSGNLMLNPQQDRRTNLEVSSQLDFINATSSFAINLFYPSWDKLLSEKVRRAFQVEQENPTSRSRVEEMKERCRRRGVPDEAFDMIDLKQVKATRIIGTGSRASRIMIYEQARPFFASMDPEGRQNFVFDILSDLMGSEKAERYLGTPGVERDSIDLSIAALEHAELLEGDWMPVRNSEDHLVHLNYHLDRGEEDLGEVQTGRIALDEWAMENAQVHRHITETLEITTVPPELEPELNALIQRAQQYGAIVVNGIREANKKAREAQEQAEGEEAQLGEDEQSQANQENIAFANSEARKQEEHTAKMQREAEMHQLKLEQTDNLGKQKIVLETQKAMAGIAKADAELRSKIGRV